MLSSMTQQKKEVPALIPETIPIGMFENRADTSFSSVTPPYYCEINKNQQLNPSQLDIVRATTDEGGVLGFRSSVFLSVF